MQGHPPYSGVVAPSTPGGRPASWAATGRFGGVSDGQFESWNLATHVGDRRDDVVANRDALRALVSADELAVMGAVHGADVAVACEAGEVAGVDALISRNPGLAVAALGADCLVMAVIGDDDETVAAVHCGWRGLALDVAGVVIDRMRTDGVEPAHVVLGPAICGACYPVPVLRADEVRDTCSGSVSRAAIVRCTDGQPGIDVRRGVAARLVELEVDARIVTSLDACTAEDPAFFSHRRDGVTGRQGMVVVRHRSGGQ